MFAIGVRYALAKATTVAVRYSAVRQQFVDAANPKKWDNKVVETPVLDYTMQQYRLLPTVAAAYACFFTGSEMIRLYNLNQVEMQKGNFGLLADLHASSSGLKSLTTTMAAEAIEDCRRACGGHGYSLFSGLGQFYQDYLPNVTVSRWVIIIIESKLLTNLFLVFCNSGKVITTSSLNKLPVIFSRLTVTLLLARLFLLNTTKP